MQLLHPYIGCLSLRLSEIVPSLVAVQAQSLQIEVILLLGVPQLAGDVLLRVSQ